MSLIDSFGNRAVDEAAEMNDFTEKRSAAQITDSHRPQQHRTRPINPGDFTTTKSPWR